MPIATPEVYAEMLNRARDGKFAYPAINVTSSQTITAALQGFAEAESDGIIQVSVGGAEYGSGSTIKNRVTGSLALAAYAYEVAKNYGITVATQPNSPSTARGTDWPSWAWTTSRTRSRWRRRSCPPRHASCSAPRPSG